VNEKQMNKEQKNKSIKIILLILIVGFGVGALLAFLILDLHDELHQRRDYLPISLLALTAVLFLGVYKMFSKEELGEKNRKRGIILIVALYILFIGIYFLVYSIFPGEDYTEVLILGMGAGGALLTIIGLTILIYQIAIIKKERQKPTFLQ
jgi:membrane protease YdiL (CAAX protease family)